MAALPVLLRDPAVRLLTLTGPGGVGKTRLSIEVARTLGPDFPDGVFFVSLAETSDPTLVPAAVAWQIGIREIVGRPIVEVLATTLATWQSLLVIDNFEQVLDAAPMIVDLLATCPGLRFVVTSRVLLNVRGEYHFPVSTLGVPDPGQMPSLPDLAGLASVRLFTERARAATGSFILDGANASAVAQICHRLDGLPLAIELAAPWLRLLTPAMLAKRLHERLLDLGGGPQDLPIRQHTIRHIISWSFDLLDSDDQRLFAHLGVFAGGWTIESGQAVAGEEVQDFLAGLGRLLDRNLVYRTTGTRDTPRFGMLETVRVYAREQLVLSGEREDVERRHREYFIPFVARARAMLDGPEHADWMSLLASEHDNLRAILDRALESGYAQSALRLGTLLWQFWAEQGHLSEAQQRLEASLAIKPSGDAPIRADAVYILGNIALDLGDFSHARDLFAAFLAIMEGLGDEEGIADGHNGLGLAEREFGAYDQARMHFELALAGWTNATDSRSIGLAYHNLGMVSLEEGAYHRASSFHNLALATHETLSNIHGIAYSKWALGVSALLTRDLFGARRLFEESLMAFRNLGDRRGEALVLGGLGKLAQSAGSDLEALEAFGAALVINRSLGARRWIVDCIEGVASVMVKRGHLEYAVKLLGAVMPLRGTTVAVATAAERKAQEETLVIARRTLTESAFQAAWNAGMRLSLEQATVEALKLTEETAVITRPAAPFNLTRREQEVLALLCQHLTDTEIAQRLYLSPRTASNHVASILSKLGVGSRREAIAFATRHGLTN